MTLVATASLIVLYGLVCYRCASIPYTQAAILVLTSLVMMFWKSCFSHPIYQSSSRKTISSGWNCSTLLLPIAIIAHSTDAGFNLHEVAISSILFQAIVASFNSPFFLAVLVSLFSGLVATSDLSPIVFLRTGLSASVLQATLLVGLKGTFSIGEASLMAQMVVLLKFLWASNGSTTWTIFQKISYGMWLSSIISTMIFVVLSLLAPGFNSPLFLLLSFISVSLVTKATFQIDLGSLKYELQQQLSNCGGNSVVYIWIVGLIFAGITSWTFFNSEKEENDEVKLQIFRKTFHLIALFMFLPAGLCNLPLTQLGLSFGLSLFVILEATRIISPNSLLGSTLSNFQGHFATNLENEGRAIIPHFFLLLGCAVPILVSNVPNSIHAYAGVFSLCITDASAAIAGSLFGDHKWPGSNKTAEGTLVALIATYLFFSFITESIAFEQPVPDLPHILVYSLVLPFWEAISDQNDNLTLPLIAYSISSLLF